MNDITDKQRRCIHVLCTKLSKPEPAGLDGWTRTQASECIEGLAKEVDKRGSFQDASQLQLHDAGGNRTPPLTRDSQVRLGLAAKLTHQQWAMAKKSPVNGARDDFKREVVELYALLGEVEQQVVNGGGVHA